MIDADCAAQYTLPQTDLYKKTLVKINFLNVYIVEIGLRE